jgi:hypothetical protein
VSGFSSGARPPTRLIAAAYIPASPRAEATPPADAWPLARTVRELAKPSSVPGSGTCSLNAIDVSVCGPVGAASSTACSAAVGAIGCTERKRGSSASGSPRKKSSPYGARIRSSYTSWSVRPVTRRTTSPVSAPITSAW